MSNWRNSFLCAQLMQTSLSATSPLLTWETIGCFGLTRRSPPPKNTVATKGVITILAVAPPLQQRKCCPPGKQRPPVLRQNRVRHGECVHIPSDVFCKLGMLLLVAPSQTCLLSKAKRDAVVKLASGPFSEGATPSQRQQLGLGLQACTDKELAAILEIPRAVGMVFISARSRNGRKPVQERQGRCEFGEAVRCVRNYFGNCLCFCPVQNECSQPFVLFGDWCSCRLHGVFQP